MRSLIEERFGSSPGELVLTAVGGGCINNAVRLDFGYRESVFLKWNSSCPADFFAAEAEGLVQLAQHSRLKVPEVLGRSDAGDIGPPWLALEYVAPGNAARDFGAQLGTGLAALHGRAVDPSYGWPTHNYIGTLPQVNTEGGDWGDFWRTRRLEPLFDRARQHFTTADQDGFHQLCECLDDILAPDQDAAPAFLHGDLWSGNVYAGPDGAPVLVDPAVYRGHREVDMAMTALFGGFSRDFYEAYEAAAPMAPDESGRRRHVYQLYPLLVHVNLFGETYVEGVRRAISGALG